MWEMYKKHTSQYNLEKKLISAKNGETECEQYFFKIFCRIIKITHFKEFEYKLHIFKSRSAFFSSTLFGVAFFPHVRVCVTTFGIDERLSTPFFVTEYQPYFFFPFHINFLL